MNRHNITRCLGGVTVTASDLRSSGRGIDSRSGRHQAIPKSTQPSIPSSTGLSNWEGGARSLVSGGRKRCDPIWQVTPRSSEMGFP